MRSAGQAQDLPACSYLRVMDLPITPILHHSITPRRTLLALFSQAPTGGVPAAGASRSQTRLGTGMNPLQTVRVRVWRERTLSRSARSVVFCQLTLGRLDPSLRRIRRAVSARHARQ